MKKLLLVIVVLFALLSCNEYSERTYLVVKKNGDTLYVNAYEWKMSLSGSGVAFRSPKGNQFISDVKDILIKD